MNALPLISVLFPLSLALMGLLPPLARIAGLAAPWASLPALLLALTGAGSGTHLSLPSVLLGAQLQMDEIGRIFLLLTALLWLASGLSTMPWPAAKLPRGRQTYLLRRYWFFFLLALTGNLGVAISLDAVSFYTFFALMTFGGFGLIAHDQSVPTRTAGRVYLSLALAGEMSILTGLMLLSQTAYSLPNATTGLLFAGFGVKVGLVPLHVWVPLSYSAAPVPAAAVLSGAVTKAGILGWIRFLPLGMTYSEDWALIGIACGVLMAFFGALMGVAQTELKPALAYSSLSQMGYLTLAIGTAAEPGAPTLHSLTACLAYAVHHGITKSALFLGVGVIAITARSSLERKAVLFPLLLMGLSLAGVPFTGGAYVKALLKESGSQTGRWHDLSEIILMAGSVATAVLVARIMILFIRAPHRSRFDSGMQVTSPWIVLPWSSLVLLSLVSPLLIPSLLSAANSEPYGSPLTWILAFLVLILTCPIWVRTNERPAIPPGDLWIPVQHVIRSTRSIEVRFFRPWSGRLIEWKYRAISWSTLRAIRFFSEFEKLRTRGYAGVGLLLIVWAALWLLLTGVEA